MSDCNCEKCCKRCEHSKNLHREVIIRVLESKFSIRILMWLEISGPDTLRGILDGVTGGGESEKSAFLRIQELREIGLVEFVREDRGQSGAKTLRQLTPEGHMVAKKLLELFEEVES